MSDLLNFTLMSTLYVIIVPIAIAIIILMEDK